MAEKMITNYSNYSSPRNVTFCINEAEIFLAPFLRWLIPVLAVAGILGNTMILIVLNSSKSMKTKPHLLLSAMAATDLAHTVVAFVMKLYIYEGVIENDTFSRVYHHVLKTPFLMLANWMAMTSTWLAVAVTIERLIAIRYPLKARFVMRKRIIVAVILAITMVSFVVSSYYLFWLRPTIYVSCRDQAKKLYRLLADQRLSYYGHTSRMVHSVLCSLLPVILLFSFNTSLVYHLHRNQALMRKFHDNQSRMSKHSGGGGDVDGQECPSMLNGMCNNNSCTMSSGDAVTTAMMGGGQQQTSTAGATIKRECKVAVVVLVISLTSACCLLPSAALVVYDAYRLVVRQNTTPAWYFPAGDISNLLLMIEKVLDFFLYCLTSGYFRRRLIMVLNRQNSTTKSTPRGTIHKRLSFLKRKGRGSGDSATSTTGANVVYTKHERRPSTSTLSTFVTPAAIRSRRGSSEGSQKSQKSPRFLMVPGSDEVWAMLDGNQNL